MYYLNDFIYEFKFPFISSNMYMIVEKNEKNALIIDPQRNEEAVQILEKANINRVLILLTHEHFDHTSGVPYLQERFECEIICHTNALQTISQKRNNRPILAYMLTDKHDNQEKMKDYFRGFHPYRYSAERVCVDYLYFTWNSHEIIMRHAPGHSPASVLIELDGRYIFTGDSLIPNIQVITRFPGGDQDEFEAVTLPLLRNIDKDKIIMPGHGEPVNFEKLVYSNFMFKVLSDEE